MEKIDINTIFGFWPKRNVDASIERLLSRMDKAGIDRAVTCSIRGICYDFKEGNDETFAACIEHKRLIPAATINPSSYFGVMEEVARIIEKGCKILRFFPTDQEWNISQRHFAKLLEKLSSSGLILMLPATEGITNIAHAAEGVNTPIVIETIRSYPNLAELIVVLQENANLYVETHSVGSMDFIELLVKEIGAHKLLFGSGAPLNYIGASVLPILNGNIRDEDKKSILSENIKRLLNENN